MRPFARIPNLLRRRRADIADDVDAEIEAHLEARARQLVDQGVSPEHARAEALKRFGNLSETRQAMYESALRELGRARLRDSLTGVVGDLRLTLRQLRRSPVFALGVVITLALGIAANTAMFDVLDRLLLRPPAHVREPSRIVRAYLHSKEGVTEATITEVSYRRFVEVRDVARDAVDLAAIYEGLLIAGKGEVARQVRGALVSQNFWSMMGVRPAFGRFFDQGAENAGGDGLVVLGHDFWTTAFGGDTTAIGRSIDLGARSFLIIGIAPRGFAGDGVSRVDVWLPVIAAPAIFTKLGPEWTRENSFRWLMLIGRLRDGVSQSQAAAALAMAYQRSMATERSNGSLVQAARATVWPLQLERGPERNDGTRVALWLGAVAVIVMLLACANVANLMLARGLRRRSEIAVRVALGVSRRRLVRQLLLESLLLASAAAAAGAGLAVAGGSALRAILLPGIVLADASIDGRLLAFASLAGVIACLVSGLGPALYASRTDLAGMLSAATRVSGSRSRLRTALLVGQAALSTVLLVGAGLFVRSLGQARATDMGFDADRLLVVRVELRNRDLVPGVGTRVLRAFAERLRSVPGIEGATTTMQIPFSVSGSTDIAVPGIDSVERLGEFRRNSVGDDYFRTLGTRIIAGRPLAASDRFRSPRALVVSDSTARLLWPGRSALGMCVKMGGAQSPCSEVVGVATNIHQYEVRAERMLQLWDLEVENPGEHDGPYAVLVRAQNPRGMISTVRQVLGPLTPPNAFVTVRPLGDSIERVIRPWRLGAVMFGLFGSVGLLIAAVGLYSVLTYVVDQRRRELGVRVALGAGAGRLVGLVVGQSVIVVSAGVAIGLFAASLAAPWLGPLLIGVGPRDPAVLGVVGLTLLLAATVASLIPGWRAASVNPVEVLHAE